MAFRKEEEEEEEGRMIRRGRINKTIVPPHLS